MKFKCTKCGGIFTEKERKTLGHAVHGYCESMGAVGSLIGLHPHLHGREGSVFFCAEFHANTHGFASTAGDELFFPSILMKHRTPGCIRGPCGQLVEEYVLF